MQAAEASRAMAAAMSTASSLGLAAGDAIVLQNSNKLTLRLLPCDVLARVAPVAHQVAQFEIELAQRLAGSGSPVAALEPRVDPRVYERDRGDQFPDGRLLGAEWLSQIRAALDRKGLDAYR